MKVRDPLEECRHGMLQTLPCAACDEELPAAALVPPDPRTVQIAANAYEERTGQAAGGFLIHPRDVMRLFDRAAVCGNYQPRAPVWYSGLRVVQCLAARRGTQVVCSAEGRVARGMGPPGYLQPYPTPVKGLFLMLPPPPFQPPPGST